MEIRIAWDFGGIHNEVNFEDSSAGRNAANEIWLSLRDIEGVTNLYPAPKPPKRKVCQVVFFAGGKRYTYLTKESVDVGSQVVVYTSDGPQIVTVVDNGEMSDSELEKICPLNKFQYIHGKVVPV